MKMIDYTKLPNRNIIVIDMKSFFATCECVERGLDPFTTPLVVAEPGRNGAITLAVTPYMKSLELAHELEYMKFLIRLNILQYCLV